MPIGPLGSLKIDCEDDAAYYLTGLPKEPKYRSMHEVLHRSVYVKAEHREYFIKRGREMLRDDYGVVDE
jgi:hypothetical protein